MPAPTATLKLSQLLQTAFNAAQAAGVMLQRQQQELGALQVDSKSSAVDLVSQADRDAEDLIRERLLAATPGYAFLGEETAGGAEPPAGPCWVVDPLDGTSNYLAGLLIWSVSIALCSDGLEPLLGVVHAPRLGQSWSGIAGGGAHTKARALRVRTQPPGGGLHNAMLATGFPYDVCSDGSRAPIDHYSRMQQRFHKIRRLGSAAIDLALVAEGVFDGMWETRLHSWDAAAGVLLVREAGGLCQRFDGTPYTPGDDDLLCAATPELAAEIRSTLALQ